nr:MAG TPA: hypothetical protein [Caudoviricetes sp.]
MTPRSFCNFTKFSEKDKKYTPLLLTILDYDDSLIS